MFHVGASSGEESQSSEQPDSMDSKLGLPQRQKNDVFGFGSSNDRNSLPQRIQPQSTLTKSIPKPLAAKKHIPFREVATRTLQNEQVYDDDVSETDEGDIDESAIEDDDSPDWEDSYNTSIDEKTFFQRVDSRPKLTSHGSLITILFRRSEALANDTKLTPALQRRRTSSPNGPPLQLPQVILARHLLYEETSETCH